LINQHIKKIFSHSLIYGVGNVINRFLGFLLLPVYTHYFAPSEFGIYSLVYAFWFFAAVFYLYGMETSFQKFCVEAKTFEDRRNYYSSTILLIFITSVCFSLLIFSLSRVFSNLLTGNEGNYNLIRILAILMVVDALSRFNMILLNAEQRSKVYTYINISGVIVNIFFNILFIIILHYGIESIFYSFIISYTYIFIISFLFCIKYFHLKISKDKLNILTSFGFKFILYGIFMISLDFIDRFFLGYYKGEAEVGIYSACYRIGMVMNLLISGFRTAWIPFFLNLKNEENNKLIFSKIFSLFFYTGLFVFLVVALFGNEIVRFKIGNFSVLDKAYWGGMIILPYILFSYLIFGLYTNIYIASYYSNKIGFLIISSAVGCISNVLLNIILIPRYSLYGAAISTLISYLLMFSTLYYFSQQIYFIKYEWKRIIITFTLTLFLYLFNSYFFQIMNIANISNSIVYLFKLLSILILIIVLWQSKWLKIGGEISY